MVSYIGLDAHAETCTAVVVNEKGWRRNAEPQPIERSFTEWRCREPLNIGDIHW